MFNRYLSEDRDAFEDLYRPVEVEPESDVLDEPVESASSQPQIRHMEKDEESKSSATSKGILGAKLDFKRILKGINIGDGGLLPLLLLVFLVLDVEEDEKLLIFALAIVLGI